MLLKLTVFKYNFWETEAPYENQSWYLNYLEKLDWVFILSWEIRKYLECRKRFGPLRWYKTKCFWIQIFFCSHEKKYLQYSFKGHYVMFRAPGTYSN